MATLRLPLAPALALALLLPLAPPAAATGGTVDDYDLTVDGEPAHGLLGVPASTPTTLVVVTHGWTHNAESHRGHLQTLADAGYLAVAMDFRGSGFPLGAGANDTRAAVADLRAAYPSVTDVALFSVSMGAAVGGMLLADQPGFASRWFLSEPMANLAETWAEATAVCPFIAFACAPAAQIEAECRGTPAAKPACYRERVAVARVPEFAGLAGAMVVHGVNDGLVPHNQGREIATALRAHGVPTDFVTVLRGEPGQGGTTLSGYAGQDADGMAGHGTESDDAHTLTAHSWDLFLAWLRGDVAPTNAEAVVDRDLGAGP